MMKSNAVNFGYGGVKELVLNSSPHLLNTSVLLIQEEDTDLTNTSKNEMWDFTEKYKDEATQEMLDVAS